jgi:hypothetical protein
MKSREQRDLRYENGRCAIKLLASTFQIATITGLSLASVREILDAHYLHRDRALASSAIRKLEKGTNFSNRLQTDLNFSDLEKSK